jgi:hypothetical protein
LPDNGPLPVLRVDDHAELDVSGELPGRTVQAARPSGAKPLGPASKVLAPEGSFGLIPRGTVDAIL